MSLRVDIKSELEKFKIDISFESTSNRIGILGESGAGKSMLLKYIAGIFTPDKGRIILDNSCILNTNDKINIMPQNRNIAYMFQNYALFPTMSVRENIEIVIKGDKKQKRKKTDFLLKKFHLLNLASKKPAELSGGQQQRVALARVLAYEPKLILLDEPFSALDEELKDHLHMELETMIKDYHGMIIMVSHSRDELYRFSEEVMIISEGKLLEMDSKEKVFHYPKTTKGARLVGVHNILSAKKKADGLLEIPEWHLCLQLENQDIDKVEFIGIRDRDLQPVWNEDDIPPNEKDELLHIKAGATYETLDKKKVFFAIKNPLKNKEGKSISDTSNKYSFLYATIDLPSKLRINKEKIIFFQS